MVDENTTHQDVNVQNLESCMTCMHRRKIRANNAEGDRFKQGVVRCDEPSYMKVEPNDRRRVKPEHHVCDHWDYTV